MTNIAYEIIIMACFVACVFIVASKGHLQPKLQIHHKTSKTRVLHLSMTSKHHASGPASKNPGCLSKDQFQAPLWTALPLHMCTPA